MPTLAEAMKKINAKAPVVGGFADVDAPSGAISTGFIGIDRYLRDGGIPRGRWSSVYAPSNSGKSTLALGIIAQMHDDWDAGKIKRGRVLFVNTENTFDEEYARAIGVQVDDPDKFLITAPDDGMVCIDIMEQLVSTGEIDLVVLDSVTFMVPRAMLENEVDKTKQPATFARQNALFVRRLTGKLAKTNTAMLVVNHAVGTMKQDFYGNPINIAGGGEMLRNAMSLILKLNKKDRPIGEDGKGVANKDMNDAVASETTVFIEKNKRGRQFLNIDLRLDFQTGFDKVYDTFVTATEAEVITMAGARYSYGDHKWHGQNNVLEALRDNPELFNEIRLATRAHYGI
jgi:recombination protein RecA